MHYIFWVNVQVLRQNDSLTICPCQQVQFLFQHMVSIVAFLLAIFVLVIYLFVLVSHQISDNIVQQIINLRIATSDYTCSQAMQYFLWICDDMKELTWPFGAESFFLAVLWQLIPIQKSR